MLPVAFLVVTLAPLGLQFQAETPTQGRVPNGQDFLTLCGDYDAAAATTPRSLACVSYVAGVADAIRIYEAILETVRDIDALGHLSLLARLGALPKETIERLPTEGQMAATTAFIIKLQSDALAKGAPSPSAAMDGVTLTSLINQQVCLPSEISSTSQLVLVILKFLRDHPERLHEPRNALVFRALGNAFPCAKE